MQILPLLKAPQLIHPFLRCEVVPTPRVLVVDDEEDVLDLNVRALRCAGYEVESATDGALAWANVQFNRYDLIVTDNSMPRLSGADLIGRMRTAGMIVPVVMATSLIPEAHLARHPHCQPSAILLKPYTMAEFLGTVKRALSIAL